MDSARLRETSQFAFLLSSSSSHPAVGLGMSEPVEPIRQNELAAVMIVHLQLSSQCRRYESPGLQNYSLLLDRIMIKPAAVTPCLAWIAFPIPPPLLGYHNEIESCYVTRPHPRPRQQAQ